MQGTPSLVSLLQCIQFVVWTHVEPKVHLGSQAGLWGWGKGGLGVPTGSAHTHETENKHGAVHGDLGKSRSKASPSLAWLAQEDRV